MKFGRAIFRLLPSTGFESQLGVAAVAIRLVAGTAATAQKGLGCAKQRTSGTGYHFECALNFERAVFERRDRELSVARCERLGLGAPRFAARRELNRHVTTVAIGLLFGCAAAAEASA